MKIGTIVGVLSAAAAAAAIALGAPPRGGGFEQNAADGPAAPVGRLEQAAAGAGAGG